MIGAQLKLEAHRSRFYRSLERRRVTVVPLSLASTVASGAVGEDETENADAERLLHASVSSSL